MSRYNHLLKNSRKRVFVRDADLLAEAVKYFEWCEDNPLIEEVINFYQGEITRADLHKRRAMTKKGLAAFLGITTSRLDAFKRKWPEVMEIIEDTIFTQKFEGAAAGLLNASIITRDLGLAEKQEIAGIKDAPPMALTITPIATGTFLPPEE